MLVNVGIRMLSRASTRGKQLGALDQGPGLDVEGDQLCGDLRDLVGRPAGGAVSRRLRTQGLNCKQVVEQVGQGV